MITITTLVRVAGIFMLLLVPLNVFDVPRRFHWKQELANVSLLNRQIFQVHAAFICLVLALFGLLATLMTHPLLQPTPLARAVVGGLAVFWLLRLLAQLFVYDPRIWRGNRFYTVMHYVFLSLWIFLSGTFGVALLRTLGRA
jgi:hypothetical protein